MLIMPSVVQVARRELSGKNKQVARVTRPNNESKGCLSSLGGISKISNSLKPLSKTESLLIGFKFPSAPHGSQLRETA